MASIDWEKYWNEKAETYSTIEERNEKAAQMVGKEKKVLDVGCGHGELMRMLKKDNTVYGIDFNTKMVKQCINKGLKVLWSEATDLPFPNNHFDVVCALGLIEYLPKDEDFLKEVSRVLKPKGIAVISFRNELFSKWSGEEFEPERRMHNPDTIKFSGFKIEDTVFFHEHTPHRFSEKKYYHSGFIVKMVKI